MVRLLRRPALNIISVLAMGFFLFLLAVSGVLCGTNDIEVLPTAQFSTPFSRKIHRSMDKNPLKAFRMHTSSPTVVVNGVDYDEQYAVSATIGGQNFSVIVDTAS